ncbi:hypothetical protein HMPREF0204_10336 [Chryseobacterium gleum ATCC 35910]|uniref:Uncharacterized protein n=1 Tax=Chryseobacterium gleum ATCC 35910 TaxID=525257 RepID=A0ABN0AWS8_CHRGE|nr:hypothetical protein HMPREF0204_10336 [Chryseobacterium gleum ATCC 35910]
MLIIYRKTKYYHSTIYKNKNYRSKKYFTNKGFIFIINPFF